MIHRNDASRVLPAARQIQKVAVIVGVSKMYGARAKTMLRREKRLKHSLPPKPTFILKASAMTVSLPMRSFLNGAKREQARSKRRAKRRG